LLHILDSLARLPDTAGSALADMLAGPACRDFREGLQVIVTTDTALGSMSISHGDNDQQRFVVLKSAAFGASATPAVDVPFAPWLLVESAEQVPALLRGGWREAQHGS
jgi:hypothetical protein